jgi:signal transduction histidine kinase
MTSKPISVNPKTLARLVEFSRILNSATNVDALLYYIIKQAADLTGAEAASILLLDAHTRQLHFRASSNAEHDEMANIPVPLDSSIAGAILTENRPMLISDVSKDPRWNPTASQSIQFETESILGVPMHDVERKPIGVLEALNKQNGRFTREDAKTMTILADIAGVAVERARLSEDLEQAYESLNELDQLKTDFIAIASHELRTPLAVIMGYVSFLQEAADEATTSQLDSVMNAAIHLRDLIQAMLNLRYVDAGETNLSVNTMDWVEFCRDIAEPFTETAVTKRQTITLQLPAAPLVVRADPNVLEVALNNLINNALKFTPADGTIEIALKQQGNEAWFSISDTGVGIPEDKLERIFNRFYQIEPALVRQHGGLGIGLSIAKDLVELQNGRIWAESIENQGSTFIVALPLVNEN